MDDIARDSAVPFSAEVTALQNLAECCDLTGRVCFSNNVIEDAVFRLKQYEVLGAPEKLTKDRAELSTFRNYGSLEELEMLADVFPELHVARNSIQEELAAYHILGSPAELVSRIAKLELAFMGLLGSVKPKCGTLEIDQEIERYYKQQLAEEAKK